MKAFILYAFGILLSLGGIIFLASQFITYLSEIGKLIILCLFIIIFASLGKHLQDRGW